MNDRQKTAYHAALEQILDQLKDIDREDNPRNYPVVRLSLHPYMHNESGLPLVVASCSMKATAEIKVS